MENKNLENSKSKIKYKLYIMQRFIDAPGDLIEVVFDKFTKLKSSLITFFDSGYFLLVFLAGLGIIIYYLLRYLIGLRLGMQIHKEPKNK